MLGSLHMCMLAYNWFRGWARRARIRIRVRVGWVRGPPADKTQHSSDLTDTHRIQMRGIKQKINPAGGLTLRCGLRRFTKKFQFFLTKSCPKDVVLRLWNFNCIKRTFWIARCQNFNFVRHLKLSKKGKMLFSFMQGGN